MRPLPKTFLIASALLLAAVPARAEEDSVFDEAFPPRNRAPLGIVRGTAQVPLFATEAVAGFVGASQTLFGGDLGEARYAQLVNQTVFHEAAERVKAKHPELASNLDSYLEKLGYDRAELRGARVARAFTLEETKAFDALIAEERTLVTMEMAQGRIPPRVQATFAENRLAARTELRLHRAILVLSPLVLAQGAVRVYELYHDRNPGYLPLYNLGSAIVRRQLFANPPTDSESPSESSPVQED